MTNREAHEEAAGMGLCPEFFMFNNIDPDAEYEVPNKSEEVNKEFKERRKI